jgi:hypothetical protein
MYTDKKERARIQAAPRVLQPSPASARRIHEHAVGRTASVIRSRSEIVTSIATVRALRCAEARVGRA